jgi:hypothetical protein
VCQRPCDDETYMGAVHVFVEGAADSSPEGLTRLATAIASHYGLPAPELLLRLQAGRFRVKGNIDRATAATYVRDLERLGARCTIEDASSSSSRAATPLPFPAVNADGTPRVTPPSSPAGTGAAPSASGLAAAGGARAGASTPATGLAAAGARPGAPTPATGLAAAAPRSPTAASTPPSGLAAIGPRAAGTASTPPSALAAIGAAPNAPGGASSASFQSGLAAAFSGETSAADLGALERADAFAIASLDGADDPSAPPAASFEPPGAGGLPASIGPAATTGDAKAGKDKTKADRPKDEPLDMFAPPDMQGDELQVDIADDEKDVSARKRASTPAPVATDDPPSRTSQPRMSTAPVAGGARASQPSIQPSSQPPVGAALAAPATPSKFGPLGEPRVRFAAGVLLAVLLGFVPAHFIANWREQSASEAIDRKVIAEQRAADTPDVYANLDRFRADQLARKASENRNAALIGFAIWALVGGGIAFAWFKKIPWDS